RLASRVRRGSGARTGALSVSSFPSIHFKSSEGFARMGHGPAPNAFEIIETRRWPGSWFGDGQMPKLIVVTNREPYALKKSSNGGVGAERQTAGLLGALEPVVQTSSGVWISWSGFEREAPRDGEGLPEHLEVEVGEQHWSLHRLPLSEREASLYHYGWACRTQWPLMHLMLGRGTFDAEAWRAYRRVSQRFADAVLEVYEPGDRIWIHEHHLALVPGLLRAARPDAQIPSSWNIPWPPIDALAALPWAGELCAGVLGADVVGVSLPRYAGHLVAAAQVFLGAKPGGPLASGSNGNGRTRGDGDGEVEG